MSASSVALQYRGDNKLILGIMLAVITFWLFAQTTLNVAPAMRSDLGITESTSNIAVSITALFSKIFIVVAGGLADQFGRLRFTYVGLVLSIVGSLLVAVSPSGTAAFLMIGRVVQGISAACIMPATLALMKVYFDGKDRQRALSFWVDRLLGRLGPKRPVRIFWMSIAVAVVSVLLLRGTPENKAESTARKSFDWRSSSAIQAASSISVCFGNKTFSGATLSNCLLNGAAGTLLVVLTLVQEAAGLPSLQSGLLTVGCLVGVLVTIRIGEKLLQSMGYRTPMLMGCSVTGMGIALTALTFLVAIAIVAIMVTVPRFV